MTRLLIILLLSLNILLLGLLSIRGTAPEAEATTRSSSTIQGPRLSAERIEDLINAERTKAGLPILADNPLLDDAACRKADDMLAKDYWAHTSPEGLTPWYFFEQVGYNYRTAGENLAYGYESDEATVTGWMNSPTHRDNIMLPAYIEQGVCVRIGLFQGEQTHLIVSHFGVR